MSDGMLKLSSTPNGSLIHSLKLILYKDHILIGYASIDQTIATIGLDKTCSENLGEFA